MRETGPPTPIYNDRPRPCNSYYAFLTMQVINELVVTAVLVAGFLGLTSCQMAMDCALPTGSEIEAVLRELIAVGDSASTPDINVISFTPRCLAVSEQRDRYRAISILVNYTCTGNPLCPAGGGEEQIESDCVNGVWGNEVLGGASDLTRDTTPEDAPASVPTRQDCAFCASPDLAMTNGIQSDDVYHCVGE